MAETAQQPSPNHAEEPKEPSRWKSAWAVRAYLSTIGQGLLLYAGLKTQNDSTGRNALIGFAGVNLLANAINAIFGGQKKEDKHQLHYLKSYINEMLAPLVGDAAQLPAADEKLTAAAGRAEGQSRVMYWLQKYSVTLSEFVLRTAGSISLIIPFTNWGASLRHLKNGTSLRETFALVKTKDPVTLGAGLFSLAGKGFILAASEPDPYNPKPMTFWRSLREKVMFKMSSVSEVICSIWMGYDGFKNKRINVMGVDRPDYARAVGNASIITGYIPRWIAPYGTREVNMPELYAHIAKALEAVLEEKREAAKLHVIGEMKTHFKDKPMITAKLAREIDQRMTPQTVASLKPPAEIDKPTTRVHEGLFASDTVSRTYASMNR